MSRLMLAVLCPIIILGALEPGKVLATENGRASTQSSVAQGLSPRQDPPQTAEDVFNALRLKRPTTTIVPESRRGRGSILAASDRLIFPEGHRSAGD